MRCLVVVAHPLDNSLCAHLASEAVRRLTQKGYDVTVKNLYQEHFNPVLNPSERESYYQEHFDQQAVVADIEQLKQAESLVLVFPTWWFGFPAILKGWFDRVWAPGHAFDHATDLGPIAPRLDNLKEMTVITTLGSPWWVDVAVLRRPVRRVLKTALLGACTRNCRFRMATLYRSESVSEKRLAKFISRIESIC